MCLDRIIKYMSRERSGEMLTIRPAVIGVRAGKLGVSCRLLEVRSAAVL